FLSAQDRGIPQLQRVIVTDGTTVSMAAALTPAIAALPGETTVPPDADPPDTTAAPREDRTEWPPPALRLTREADARLRAGDFAGFGAAWSRLRALLEQQAAGDVPQ